MQRVEYLIGFDNYRVCYSELFQQFRIYSTFSDNFYYWFTPLSCINTCDKFDVTETFPKIEIIEQTKDLCKIRIVFNSSIWERKEAYYVFTADGIEHYLKVNGTGIVTRVYFCMGLCDDMVIGSVPGFDSFVPGCPNFLGKKRFFPSDFFSINVTNETSHWGLALNSGPLIYLFEKEEIRQCLYAGIIATAGTNIFDCFDFNHKPTEVIKTHDNVVNTQSFSLDYAGHLTITGEWESPHLYLGFGKNRLECLSGYCNLLENRGAIDRVQAKKVYEWWHKPIFCGWHEQVALNSKKEEQKAASRAQLEGGDAKNECTQQNYQKWIDILKQNKIPIGTIIIDAQWQRHQACFEVDISKWPDMRGFIDGCHADDLKVLLWIQAWSKEGLNIDECILMGDTAIAMDPTSPKYQDRLRDGISYMLGSNTKCLNADGLKIDGTNTIPTGQNMKTYKGTYGFELQHEYLSLIYNWAKNVKKDALISLYTANPYFRDVCDMVRMGDLYSVYGRPIDTLRERAEITKITMPAQLIDTDGTLHFSMEENVLKELEEQVKIGIPTLYQIEYLYQCRTFNKPVIRKVQESDYTRIRSILDSYNRYLDKECHIVECMMSRGRNTLEKGTL